MTIRTTLAICATLFIGCMPQTDRDRYVIDEPGIVSFENPTTATLYLAGCSHFDYEQQVGDEWVSQGPDVVCVWEGFAEAVPPGAVVRDPIHARSPGTWRLRYPVGIDCTVTSPLREEHCRAVGSVTSNPFEVVASGCVVSGCSGQLCAEEPMASTCEWLPQYACYQSERCGRFGPEGSCAWEPTPELAACLADATDATSR